MFFEQFVLPSLGHASYVVGDERTGRALLLDPRRDVDVYFDYLRSKGLRLEHAVDTHGHNDYLSGLQEVVARQRVELLGYAEADLGYDHRPIKDGEVIEMGDVTFEVLHTPGHTPEHISLLVYDESSDDEPALMLSGGALLVGDLARPDLLGGPEAAREAATEFCHTIQEKILWKLADHVEVFPTHVSGSLCGGNIGTRLSTTVGYERKTNAVLSRISSSEEFVDECIRVDNLPAVPPYWRRMRAQNLAGPELLGVLPEPSPLQVAEVAEAQERGATVLDTRDPDAFSGAHIPGALNVGLGSSFPTWAGTVVSPGSPVVLVLDRPGDLWEATWELLRIGYDLPIGWLAGGMGSWRRSERETATLPQIPVDELRDRHRRGEIEVLDVRQPAEWAAGHIAGARFVTGADLPSRIDDVPSERPVAVVCGAGYRSSALASLLASRTGRKYASVLGGMSAWRAAGYETTTDE